MTHDTTPGTREFDVFVAQVEPRLRQALVANYGPVDGREATVDALSWAWENWGRLELISNQSGYLYRVGQSAVRRFGTRPIPWRLADARVAEVQVADVADVEPGLLPALDQLSEQQRTIVLLVHAHGWSQAEVSRTLEINPSTVREHLTRALTRLRTALEVQDVN